MDQDTHLARIADALQSIADRLAPPADSAAPAARLVDGVNAYHWQGASRTLEPVPNVNRVPLGLLKGVEALKSRLLDNTRQFAQGHGANNVLLWGARGMGKSSLIKAVHEQVAADCVGDARLILVEIGRDELGTLPALLRFAAGQEARILVFCDDLSFDREESGYKALKSMLDGGIEGRPVNALFYATSNRRHLMARDMIENEQSTAINPGESVDEKVSLADRFGLWLGFHNCDQETYLAMVAGYVDHYGITIGPEALRAQALEWAMTRGGRSGRVAIQFVRDLAGRNGQSA